MTHDDDLRVLLTSFRTSAALAVAADLGLSDLLAGGPRTVADLAATTSTDTDTLHRLLHALSTVGVYAERPDGSYASTPLSEGLRSGVPGSLRPLARTLTDPAVWAACGHLGHSVRTGESAFEALHGQDVWAHRRQHPEHNDVFNQNMAALSSLVGRAVARGYDFGPRSHVVDVGGGYGVLLAAVLAHHPHLTGTVFDQAHALASGPPDGTGASVAAGWSTVSGSFFEAVPPADCYLLKSILHDWPDVETVLGRPGLEADAAFSDLNMLVLPGGRERTEPEYDALMRAAGLRLSDVTHTASRMSVLEARSAD